MDTNKIEDFGILAVLCIDDMLPEIVLHHKLCGYSINTRSDKVDGVPLANFIVQHQCEDMTNEGRGSTHD